jgi:hypothetical protein
VFSENGFNIVNQVIPNQGSPYFIFASEDLVAPVAGVVNMVGTITINNNTNDSQGFRSIVSLFDGVAFRNNIATSRFTSVEGQGYRSLGNNFSYPVSAGQTYRCLFGITHINAVNANTFSYPSFTCIFSPNP